MITFILRILVKVALGLRYRIRLRGLETVVDRDGGGILFLPNHPALIDPIIVMTVLHARFRPRALADETQIDRFFIRWMAKRVGVLPIPDMAASGPAARGAIERALDVLAECLSRGENVLLYPTGHLSRQRLEDLGGNSAVQKLLHMVPHARVVLIRTRGLWGSSFSWASGRAPNVRRAIFRAIRSLLVSGIFFAPRRDVTVEFHRQPDSNAGPSKLRSGDRAAINRYLENFYNKDAPYNTYVPYTVWERGEPRRMPEPKTRAVRDRTDNVPSMTRTIVTNYLRELAGVDQLDDSDQLGRDLGLDSLGRSELLIFLNREFGFPQSNVDSLRTVEDVLLAACGEPVGSDSAVLELRPIPGKWFSNISERETYSAVSLPKGTGQELPKTVADVFLAQARLGPSRPIISDQSSGVKTYRDVITAVMILRPEIEKLPGQQIGIMLPASVTADIVYLATLFAGKVPVMVNWTVGVRNMTSSLDTVEAKIVLTAKTLVNRIESQGVEFGKLTNRFVYLENVATEITRWTRLFAALRTRLSWSSLTGAKIPETAAVLFTSGSETLPKAVPLTHTNLLMNLRDAIEMFQLFPSDRLLDFLPPFHSFGLTVGMLVPLCLGIPTVYHPSPNESAILAAIVDAYNVTILVGTPTFLNGIVRASTPEQLSTVRLAVTGAEKCPQHVYTALKEQCPRTVFIEGYGVTECSPIVSVNDEDDPKEGTIGKVLRSFEYALVDPESNRRVSKGSPGVLLVRGPCVFDGYIGTGRDAPGSPFIAFEGERWYRTGDLVTEDPDGVLTFCGRLKRFVKIGGEMISLPAIESVLEAQYPRKSGEGADRDVAGWKAVRRSPDRPLTAVVASEGEGETSGRVELVLFTTHPLNRETVNVRIREAGLSPLHNIRRVIRVEEIPVLGTGKTDYRELSSRL